MLVFQCCEQTLVHHGWWRLWSSFIEIVCVVLEKRANTYFFVGLYGTLQTRRMRTSWRKHNKATSQIPNLWRREYPDRLIALKLPILAYRRQMADLIEVYKIVKKFDNLEAMKVFQMDNGSRTRGHRLKTRIALGRAHTSTTWCLINENISGPIHFSNIMLRIVFWPYPSMVKNHYKN